MIRSLFSIIGGMPSSRSTARRWIGLTSFNPGKTSIALGAIVIGLFAPFCASATQVDKADVINKAAAETEARLLTTPTGAPACFLPVSVVKGAEVHILGGGSRREIGGTKIAYGGYGVIDIELRETAKPVVLILRNRGPTIWKISLTSGAQLKGVYLSGRVEQFVAGLPQDIPVVSTYDFDIDENPQADCAFLDSMTGSPDRPGPHLVGEDFLPQFRLDHPRLRLVLEWLPDGLADYANATLASYQNNILLDGVTVSRASIERFEALKQKGRDWLAKLKLPALPLQSPNAPILNVPENLQGEEAVRWIIDQGYGMEMTWDVQRYLCDFDRALGEVAGLPAVYGSDSCRYGIDDPKHWTKFGRRRLILLGSVRVTKPSCKGARVLIFVPPGIPFERERNCSWSAKKFPTASER